MDPADLLDLPDGQFLGVVRTMPGDEFDSLPSDVLRAVKDRWRKLSPAHDPERQSYESRLIGHVPPSLAFIKHLPRVVDLYDFLAQPIPQRPVLLAPTILAQSLAMIHSWRGIGKTHSAIGLAYALASGGTFLCWKAPEPRKVLFVDGEMPARALQERLASTIAISGREAAAGFFKLLTPDLQTGAVPDLATIEGQDEIDGVVEPDTALIVLDNLSCLVRRGGAENDAESWQLVSEWALKHRAAGRSILFIHHSGKNGGQRGTSKREDLLDVVIALKRPSDYDPAEGARFEVHYEKSRGFFGDDVAPFEARLALDAHGVQTWTTRAIEDSTDDRVLDLLGLGLSKAEIARELGVNKSTVSRAARRIEEAHPELRVAQPSTRNAQLFSGSAQRSAQRRRN